MNKYLMTAGFGFAAALTVRLLIGYWPEKFGKILG